MTDRFLPFFLAILLLSACTTSAPPSHGGEHAREVTTEQRLSIEDQSTRGEIAFAVRDGDAVFRDYGISHTKEMHLIVVRDDLRYFHHLHPERDGDGIWQVDFTPPAGGMYWRYADFVDTEERPYTIRFERAYPGDPGAHGIVKNFETVKTFDGYRFSFQPKVSGDEVTFTYDITDSEGQPVQLEEYLGAKGHSVLISPSGDFIHTHPPEKAAVPVFATSLPSDDFYRIFTQFQIKGEIVTVDFDWQP